jgi:hypothetical protein
LRVLGYVTGADGHSILTTAVERAVKYAEVIKSGFIALIGVGFFFAIIGVFGLFVAVASLVAFIAVAVWIFADSEQLTDAGR